MTDQEIGLRHYGILQEMTRQAMMADPIDAYLHLTMALEYPVEILRKIYGVVRPYAQREAILDRYPADVLNELKDLKMRGSASRFSRSRLLVLGDWEDPYPENETTAQPGDDDNETQFTIRR